MSQTRQNRAPAKPQQGDAVARQPQKPAQSNQDVVLYMTLNNTTHKSDELPETLAALDAAETEGLGHRKLLPISDPYATKNADGSLTHHDETYKYSLGEKGSERIGWWHGDPALKPGQVRVDGEVLTLGTDNLDVTKPEETAKTIKAWKKTLAAAGMDEKAIKGSMEALFKDKDGKFRKLGSGDGATNELVQYMMAMHRAEKGEINVKQMVFSGHHWRGDEVDGNDQWDRDGGHGIWGEILGSDHDYDNQSDFFSLVDVAELKDAFPNAYKQVKSVQLAACNTDALGITDDAGNVQTTNEFLQGTFENIEMTSYWKQVLAPLAASGFASNGEFVLDGMRYENGDDKAIKDARMNARGLKRSTLNASGDLEEITMKTNRRSYGASAGTGLKGSSRKDFDERTDLADHIYTAPTLDRTKLTPEKKPDAKKPKRGGWGRLLDWFRY